MWLNRQIPIYFFSLCTLYFFQGTNPEIDSYSAFFDNGGEGDTGLQAIIKDYVTEVE